MMWLLFISVILFYIGFILLWINPIDRDMTRYTSDIEDRFNERYMRKNK
jgi:nitrate reductase gamma subunit